MSTTIGTIELPSPTWLKALAALCALGLVVCAQPAEAREGRREKGATSQLKLRDHRKTTVNVRDHRQSGQNVRDHRATTGGPAGGVSVHSKPRPDPKPKINDHRTEKKSYGTGGSTTESKPRKCLRPNPYGTMSAQCRG